MLKLLAFVLPLALDSFVIAAALGAAQAITAWQRLRISPLIGLGVGSVLAHGIGTSPTTSLPPP